MGRPLHSWTVDGSQWGIRHEFVVRLFPDGTDPARESDVSDKALAAWRRGQWRYVEVRVTLRLNGRDVPGADDVISAVVWGAHPGQRVGRRELDASHVHRMALVAVDRAEDLGVLHRS